MIATCSSGVEPLFALVYQKNVLDGTSFMEVHKGFKSVAEKEGFLEVAAAFKSIAKVELEHEKRYRALLDNVRSGQIFKKGQAVRWVCRNCGYVHEGPEAPAVCAACQHPQAYFELKSENY